MIQGTNWLAVYQTDDLGHPMGFGTAIIKIPVVYWEDACIDGNTSAQGWVLQDRDGIDLPFPVPAPNVFGFMRYEWEGPDEAVQ